MTTAKHHRPSHSYRLALSLAFTHLNLILYFLNFSISESFTISCQLSTTRIQNPCSSFDAKRNCNPRIVTLTKFKSVEESDDPEDTLLAFDDVVDSKNDGNSSSTPKIDFDGAGTLGDIMSKEIVDQKDDVSHIITESPTKSGLVTTAGGTLQSLFGRKIPNMTPLERIALTANGNLQRIFSSFYDSPVHIHVEKCDQVGSNVWDREVKLLVFNQVFCTASSKITVHSKKCVQLVQSGECGLGQLFRFLNILPTFELVDAGRSDNNGLWRNYVLQCDEVTCEIREEFSPQAWEINPTWFDYFSDHDNTF